MLLTKTMGITHAGTCSIHKCGIYAVYTYNTGADILMILPSLK